MVSVQTQAIYYNITTNQLPGYYYIASHFEVLACGVASTFASNFFKEVDYGVYLARVNILGCYFISWCEGWQTIKLNSPSTFQAYGIVA